MRDVRAPLEETLRHAGKIGSRHLLREREDEGRHEVPLTKRAPSATDAVVNGASSRSTLAMRAAISGAVILDTSDAGSSRTRGGGTRWARISVKTGVSVNDPCHQRSHRRSVRAGTHEARDAALAAANARLRRLATSTTTPRYTRRPRNRTDGGVARLRQPSRLQQRLNRRENAPVISANAPQRGFRG